MKVAITGDADVESKTILEAELSKRGHDVVYFTHMYLNICNMDDLLIEDVDLVFYWGAVGPVSRVCFSDYLDHVHHIPFVNRAILEDPLIDSKIYQAYKISNLGVDHPKTLVQSYPLHEKIVEAIGSPYVVKVTQWSSGGKDVALIDSEKNLKDFEEENSGKELLYQEFIRYDGDYRVHVVGGRSVCAYERLPSGEDFRANISLGGSLKKISDEKLLQDLFTMAERVTSCFSGLDVSGVDIVREKGTGRLYSVEVNKTPGLKQVEEITGVNVAAKVVDYLEKKFGL